MGIGLAATLAVVALAVRPKKAGAAPLDDRPSHRELDIEAPPPPMEAEAERSLPFTPFVRLPKLTILNINTNQTAALRLYLPNGRVDRRAAERLDELLADTRDPKHEHVATLNRRTLQLMFKAAYHFHAREIVVVSAYRKPGKRGEGLHASAKAIDFKLVGTTASALAEYLRTFPRAGVGQYTHPRTQFVHLDVRDRSYHWVDPSPPGARGAEWGLGRAGLDARDHRYERASDWPEGTRPPT